MPPPPPPPAASRKYDSNDDADALARRRHTSPSSFESSALVWLTLNDYGGEDGIVATPSSSSSSSSAVDATTPTTTWRDRILRSRPSSIDRVRRVIDASTIQLEKGGCVTLEAVRGVGSTYVLPDCFSYSPSYELRRYLPRGTLVRMIRLDDHDGDDASLLAPPSASSSRYWIVRDGDGTIVNEELVRGGFAYVRRGSRIPPDAERALVELEGSARERGLGIYADCSTDDDYSGEEGGGGGGGGRRRENARTTPDFVAQFEPLYYSAKTRYGDDGSATAASSIPPANPGDTRGCSDFDTYEDALRWYETYAPYYGDVARLDRNGDGVPCPGLPHTPDGERYRMKRPSNKVDQGR
jgi:hypothetical protein